MDVQIVSSITKLANYMPLGSYVIYTALETYSFSLGATPSPVTTIVETPTSNYTCYYLPGASFTYTTCTEDQSDALMISLCIGFFLALFLSFLKQVPPGGSPPLADSDDNDSDDEDSSNSGGGGSGSQGEQTTAESSTQTRVNGSSSGTLVQRKTSTSSPSKSTTAPNHKKKKSPPKPKYRAGIVYAAGNYYYLDFGDTHVWGHALLSFVAFGTLSLFSASVSQCLFPSIKPWIFVFTQIILLVICCFIAMFWIDDPSLSIGLMVVPQTNVQSTQTSNGTVPTYTTSPPPPASTLPPTTAYATTSAPPATATSYNAATSTSVPMSQSSSMSPNMTMSLYPSTTSAGLTNVALDDTALNSIMGQVSNNRSTAAFSVNSDQSATSMGGGGGGGTGVGTGVGTGAGARIASATILGGSGGLGMNVGNVSRVSLFSSPCYQNQDPQVGEKGEWIVESEQQGGEEPFSVKVE